MDDRALRPAREEAEAKGRPPEGNQQCCQLKWKTTAAPKSISSSEM
jgi:hypothetical protein